MILQNISKAMREQNYYAVALEFVIVLAGVVIGFQINAWADARADARRVAVLTEQLTEEFTLIVSDIERARETVDRRSNAAIRVRNILNSGQRPTDEAAFRRDLFEALSTNPAVAGAPTFNEMQATGQLALFDNDGLRTALVAFHQQTETTLEAAIYLLPAFLDSMAILDPTFTISLGEADGAGASIARYDFDAMAEQAAVFQTLARINQNLGASFTVQQHLAEGVLSELEAAG